MANLGVFQRKQKINLELLLNDIDLVNNPLDSPPRATVAYTDASRLKTMSSVTLNKVENDNSLYVYDVTIDDDWFYGNYSVTFSYSVNSQQYERIDTFSISSEQDFKKEQSDYLQNMINGFESGTYVPSIYEQESAEVIAAAHEIQILLTDAMKYNHTYKVIIDGVKSVNGKELKKEIVLEFDSEYKPLYSNPSEVENIIVHFFKLFTTKEVFLAIRDASQKAMVYLQQVADPNNSRYKDYNERNTPYFAMTKYVAFQASYTLMQDLIAKFSADTLPVLFDPDSIDKDVLGSSFTLGDFNVSGTDGSNEKDILMIKSSEAFRKINALIKQIKEEMIYWRDDMMTRGRRGYTTVMTGSYRTDAGSPESREF